MKRILLLASTALLAACADGPPPPPLIVTGREATVVPEPSPRGAAKTPSSPHSSRRSTGRAGAVADQQVVPGNQGPGLRSGTSQRRGRARPARARPPPRRPAARTRHRAALSPRTSSATTVPYRNARNESVFAYRDYGYVFDQMNGNQSEGPAFLINIHKVGSVADAEAYVSRLREMAATSTSLSKRRASARRWGCCRPNGCSRT